MSKPQYEPGTHRVARAVAAISGSTTAIWALPPIGVPAKVTGVNFIPDVDITGAATNNFAIGLVNKGTDGDGTTAVTSVTTFASGTDAAAHDKLALTLSATAANLLVGADDVLALARTVNASGLANPTGVVEVLYEHVGL